RPQHRLLRPKGLAACCLSGVPAVSRDLGGKARTIAVRESASSGLTSWDASREPAKAGVKPANMGDIDNHSMDIYEKQMRSALSITDPPAGTRPPRRPVSNWRKISVSPCPRARLSNSMVF